MRKIKKIISVLLVAMMVLSCVAVSASAEDEVSYVGTTGSFSLINYNIEGLPIPAADTANGRDAYLATIEIGTRLNAMNYDILALQEDYNYDLYLRDCLTKYKNVTDDNGNVLERFATAHSGGAPLGDGLNIFSTYKLFNEDRIDWDVTSGVLEDGSDELTYKGILLTTIELAPGYYLDIYNVQCDAGLDAESLAARESQLAQLAKVINKRSVYDEKTGKFDHAVIVTGDFNVSLCTENAEGSPYLVKNLVEAAHLNDAWAISTISSIIENPVDYSEYYTYASETELTPDEAAGHYDSVERILFADGNGIDISCTDFGYFYLTDLTGESLSSHCAAEAEFDFIIIDKVQDYDGNHDDMNVSSDKSFLIQFLEYIASLFRALGKLLQDWANWGNLG